MKYVPLGDGRVHMVHMLETYRNDTHVTLFVTIFPAIPGIMVGLV